MGGTGNCVVEQKIFAKIVKLADETINNDDVDSPDSELFCAVNSSKQYQFILVAIVSSPVTADLRLGFSIPSGATGSFLVGAVHGGTRQTLQAIGGLNTVPTEPSDGLLVIYGNFLTDVTEGNLSFDWAQLTDDAGDTIIRKGSMLIVYEGI